MAYIKRTGQDTILHAEKLPAVDIRIDPQFKYAGSTSFILYEIARVEQHHFVVADAGRLVGRLLWFQFEGYLENNDRRYRYPAMETITLDGLTFLHDAGVVNIGEEYGQRPASDFAHMVEFLRSKGYTLDGDTIFKRLVWLDPELRNELMIVYAEDLLTSGLRAVDLEEGGLQADHWGEISEMLHRRALESFSVERNNPAPFLEKS